MPVSQTFQAVFGHFQNLNLLALLQDLRFGRATQRAWQDGPLLCPLAHGLPAGRQVQLLNILAQGADLSAGCLHAARLLGGEPGAILRFVRFWDEGHINSDLLLRQLEEMWAERLADAQALQELLQSGQKVGDHVGEPSAISGGTTEPPPLSGLGRRRC
jgi:hypothetical protein